MRRMRVGLRLRFVKLPHIDGDRVFRDVISFAEPEERDYDDLCAIVKAKMAFMELCHRDFTVLYTDEDTGDRVVVDNAYFGALLRGWVRRLARERAAKSLAAPPLMLLGDSLSSCTRHPGDTPARDVTESIPCHRDSDEDEDEDLQPDMLASFEIEVRDTKARCAGSALVGSTSLMEPPLAPLAALTSENLARLCNDGVSKMGSYSSFSSPSGERPEKGTVVLSKPSLGSPLERDAEVLVRVQDLTCPPTHIKFYLRCVLLAVRFKTPKPGMAVAELDLGDVEDVSQAITAVTFDEVVHKAIRDHLRGDRRQVLELRQIYVRRKNEMDVRYQTNAHPLLLRLDRSSKLEVVRVLAASAPEPGNAAVITVREQLGSAGVVDVSQLIGMRRLGTNRSTVGSHGATLSESGLSMSGVGSGAYPPTCSSSSSSGPRRTTFTISCCSGNAGASTATVSGVVPSEFGMELRSRQEKLLRQQPPSDPVPLEPGVAVVTARDVRMREPLVEQHANHEEQRKQRIRRKVEVSTRCLLCGLDCEDEAACMALVQHQLSKSSRNRGTHIPTFEQVKQDLSDRRRTACSKSSMRLMCRHTFVNSSTRTVHIVHPRCAHLCSAYQSGSELEDIVDCELSMNVCALCGLSGASVACYHPQCTEMFHILCAIYSGGYVNFGQRDPYLPCPACPRHTQVVISQKGAHDGSKVLHADYSCWEDGVAFDSRVVESTDLRDPDENDGQ